MDILTGILIAVAVAIVSALISWGISLLRNWLNTKIKDEMLKQYMNQSTLPLPAG